VHLKHQLIDRKEQNVEKQPLVRTINNGNNATVIIHL